MIHQLFEYAGGKAKSAGCNRRRLASALALAGLLALAACQSTDLGTATDGLGLEDTNAGSTPLPPPSGEVFGNGQARIALLIPKTTPGNGAVVANEMRNAALMALQDFNSRDVIQLVIKDTKGTAADAQERASEAVNERASAIVGPLFSGSVNAASAVTLPAGITMLAFSTDPSVARRGVYLLSYLQTADTQRMITYAASRGARNMVAFLPNSPVGQLIEGSLRELQASTGITPKIVRYELSGPSIEAATRSAVVDVNNADSIYIPDGGQIPEVILSSLKRSGASLEGKQVYGSGQWESVKLTSGVLEGALFTGRDETNFAGFSSRYETLYNVKPTFIGGIVYDAMSLVISQVSRRGPSGGFQPQALENRQGFQGISGLFRLRADGKAERALTIYRVTNGSRQIESPAPTRFSGS